MIIDQMDTTSVIPPEWSVHVDGYRNLHVSKNGGDRQ